MAKISYTDYVCYGKGSEAIIDTNLHECWYFNGVNK